MSLLMALAPLALCGCEVESQKSHLTISVWDYSVISSGFAQYIQEKNPEYDIEWVVGNDSLDFYTYQAENGTLPDVILTRDFNRVSADDLAGSLYSLDGTDLASNYPDGVLSQISGNSNGVKYVPGASGFAGIIINSYLFETYDIPVPTDKESFIQACQAFAEKDIRGFVAGLGDAETCYEVMQGFADSSLVSKTEDLLGKIVKRGQGSTSVSVEDASFDDALSYMEQLVDQKIIQASDMSLSSDDAEKQFLEGQAAMMFLPSGQASQYGSEHNMTVRALPFFGESSSWAFAEPVFVGMVSNVKTQGVSNSTASDEVVRTPAVKVLSSIMSTESQDYYLSLVGVDKLSPTSKDDQVTLPDALTSLDSCLKSGNIRTYLPNKLVSNAMGTTLQDVVGGKVAAKDALEEVEGLLKADQTVDKTTLTSFGEGVSNLFSSTRGNVAASDIAQVAKSCQGCDVFVTSSLAARCPLYSGDKTATELKYSVAKMPVYRTTMTGAQFKDYLGKCVAAARSQYELPVLAGVHMVVAQDSDGTFHLQAATWFVSSGTNGGGTDTATSNEGRAATAPIEDEDSFVVGIAGYDAESTVAQSHGFGFYSQGDTLQDVWLEAFRDGSFARLPAYQDYFAFG